MPVTYSSPYASSRIADNLLATHGDQMHPEAAMHRQIKSKNSHTPVVQVPPPNKSASHAHGMRTPFPAAGRTVSVDEYVVTKRLGPATSHEESRIMFGPKESLSFVDVQPTSGPLAPYPPLPPSSNILSPPTPYASGSVATPANLVASARKDDSSVGKQISEAESPKTSVNNEHNFAELFLAHGNLANSLSSENRQVATPRREGDNTRKEICGVDTPRTMEITRQAPQGQHETQLGDLASPSIPRDCRVGLSLAYDHPVAVVPPCMNSCRFCYRQTRAVIFDSTSRAFIKISLSVLRYTSLSRRASFHFGSQPVN